MPEQRLHAVAVMGVEVDVGDAQVGVGGAGRGDGHGEVVVDAEAPGAGAHGMVQPRVGDEGVRSAPGHDLVQGDERSARHRRGCLVHAGEDRVIGCDEAIGAILQLDPRPPCRGQDAQLLHPRHVVGRVNALQLSDGRETRRPQYDPWLLDQTIGAHQPDRDLAAQRTQRMRGRESAQRLHILRPMYD